MESWPELFLRRPLWQLCWEQSEGRQGGKNSGNLGDYFNNPIEDDRGFAKNGSHEDGKKWSKAGYILKKKQVAFVKGSEIGFKREEPWRTLNNRVAIC